MLITIILDMGGSRMAELAIHHVVIRNGKELEFRQSPTFAVQVPS